MLLKVITIFLGAMVLVALVGRAIYPSALPKVLRRRDRKGLAAQSCRHCGKPRIGRAPCDCGGRAR